VAGLSRANEINDLARKSIVNPSGSEDNTVNGNNNQEYLDVFVPVFKPIKVKVGRCIFHFVAIAPTKRKLRQKV
jgi:hypothetical protein